MKPTDGKISIYKDFNDLQGHQITVLGALERIRSGKSKELVQKAREAKTKKEADELKKKLPAVCFSGLFNKRKDSELVEHSGYIVLDFDNVSNITQKRNELCRISYITAVWVSPSGKGLKALVQIEWKTMHKEHFDALMNDFSDIDKTGRNVSRLCFESYDPDLYFNPNAEVYSKLPIKRIELTPADLLLDGAGRPGNGVLNGAGSYKAGTFVTITGYPVDGWWGSTNSKSAGVSSIIFNAPGVFNGFITAPTFSIIGGEIKGPLSNAVSFVDGDKIVTGQFVH